MGSSQQCTRPRRPGNELSYRLREADLAQQQQQQQAVGGDLRPLLGGQERKLRKYYVLDSVNPFTRKGILFMLCWLFDVITACVVYLRYRHVGADGTHQPLFLVTSFVQCVAAVMLLVHVMPLWAASCWLRLGPQTGHWQWCDLGAIALLSFGAAGGAMCSMCTRDSPMSAAIVIGTSIPPLCVLTTIVLLVCRACVACAAVWIEAAWRFERKLSLVSVVFVCAAALCSGFLPPAVQRVELHIPGLMALADGYTICMLSDLHAGPLTAQATLIGLASQTAGLGCRVVLFNGDMAEGTVQERAALMELLLPLSSAPDGAYYVPGNHEYYNIRAPGGGRAGAAEWERWWTNHGVRSLRNLHVDLPLRSGASGEKWFTLAGVDDTMGFPDLPTALAGTSPAGPLGPSALPVVLASHRPAPQLQAAVRLGVAAVLAGHTHGGQFWPLHLPTSRANEDYLSGLYRADSMWVYVSDGSISTHATRVRLLSRAEITHVTLRAKAAMVQPSFRLASLGVPVTRLLCWLGLLAVVGHGLRLVQKRPSLREPGSGAGADHDESDCDAGPQLEEGSPVLAATLAAPLPDGGRRPV